MSVRSGWKPLRRCLSLTIHCPAVAVRLCQEFVGGSDVCDLALASIVFQPVSCTETGEAEAHGFHHVGAVFETAGRFGGPVVLTGLEPLFLIRTTFTSRLRIAPTSRTSYRLALAGGISLAHHSLAAAAHGDLSPSLYAGTWDS